GAGPRRGAAALAPGRAPRRAHDALGLRVLVRDASRDAERNRLDLLPGSALDVPRVHGRLPVGAGGARPRSRANPALMWHFTPTLRDDLTSRSPLAEKGPNPLR